MSDLIERLEGLAKDCDAARDTPSQMKADAALSFELYRNFDTILTALRTLQRIEGLAKEGSYVSIDYIVDGTWIVVFGDWQKKSSQQSVEGSTLPLAVEAAVGRRTKENRNDSKFRQ